MSTLYELTSIAKELYEILADAEVENSQQIISDTLEGIGATEKIEAYCKLIRQFEADAESYKNEKTRLGHKETVAKNNVTRLKSAVLDFLNASGQKKYSAGIFNVAKSTSHAVQIIDETKIPNEFLTPQSPKIDKVAIKNHIKMVATWTAQRSLLTKV